MITKIDWISFSVPVRYPENVALTSAPQYVSRAILDTAGQGWVQAFHDVEFEYGGGRAPFTHSMRASDYGVFIWFSLKQPFVLVEISGRGCDYLSDTGTLPAVLHSVRERVTRLDVACDMLCDTKPVDFVNCREGAKFKSGSEMRSEMGETVYLGSQKSNRYARVYRYNPPHPRAAFLRCEMVLRDQDAKDTTNAILFHGLSQTAAALGGVFGWTHSEWKLTPPTDLELQAFRPDRHGGKTEYWLHAQVLPAIEKLLREGKTEQFDSFLQKLLDLRNNNR